MTTTTAAADSWLKVITKYGVVGAIALYLIYFITNDMNSKMTKLIETQEQTVDVLEDIRYSLREQKGLTFRNQAD